MADLATSLAPESVEDFLTQAEGVVRSYCGWHIAPSTTATETFEACGESALMLNTLRLTAVSSVSVDGVEVSDYRFSSHGAVTRRCGWRGRVVVAYTHGYGVPPPEITGVVQAVAQRAKANPAGNLQSQTSGPFSASYTTNAWAGPTSEAMVLDRYRIPPRP